MQLLSFHKVSVSLLKMSELLSVKDCELVVKNYLKTEEVSIVNFKLKPLFGGNFELRINLVAEEKEASLRFFAKSTSGVPESRSIIDILEQEFNFDAHFIPKVYHTKKNLVILENLRGQGYQNCGCLTQEHLFAAVKILASLHAASLAFEESKSKVSKFRLDKEFALLHLNFNLKQPEIVDLISSLLENEQQVSKVIEDLQDRQFHSDFRKTLCHGNLNSKNLMFKKYDGAPIDCKLINMKSSFYAPPAYDVLQLVFFNVDTELRQHHWKSLLDDYYNCLKEETKKYDVDVSKMLSNQDFHRSVHHVLPLVKLETSILHQNKETFNELKDILKCPLLSKEDCYIIVENKLGTTNYKFLGFTVTPLSDVSGFLGEYHRVEINVYQSDETTINCFVKSTPKSGIPMEIAQDVNSFSREVFMYETLVAQMQKNGINTIDECLPCCYFYRPKEFMVFEDMSLLNYKNLDALKPLDLTTLTLLTQTLAKFHACSLVLEEKLSMEQGKPYRLIDFYGEYFTEPLFFEDDKHKGALPFMIGIKSVLAAVELLTEIKTETNQRNFCQFWPKLKELFYTVIKTSDRFRNVLCHGDLWTSNMMVQFQDGKPSKCVLIDFQIVRYCPPAYDLLSVLHLTTDRSTRLEHEDRLIQIYYDELRSVLNTYGLSVDSVYPYEDFIGCIKYMKPQMVLQAAIDCVLTMCTNEEISDFLSDEDKCRYVYFEDRTEFLAAMCEKSTLYRNRLKECILDIYDYCNSMCT